MILWNFTKPEEVFILNFCGKFVSDPLETANDDFLHYIEASDHENINDYVMTSYIDKGIVFMDSPKFDEKLAVSAACSHNVRLDFWEIDLQIFIRDKVEKKREKIFEKSQALLQEDYKDTMAIYLKRIDALVDIDTAYCCEYLYEHDRFYFRYRATSNFFALSERIKTLHDKSEV